MFARLSRLFRAWMGFFISVGEDPEVMLQDAIEEMRITMPKLNQVLVATRATVIRLEEERDALKRQDRNLTASIQAALRDGSAEARSVAEEDAIPLLAKRRLTPQFLAIVDGLAHPDSPLMFYVDAGRIDEHRL